MISVKPGNVGWQCLGKQTEVLNFSVDLLENFLIFLSSIFCLLISLHFDSGYARLLPGFLTHTSDLHSICRF